MDDYTKAMKIQELEGQKLPLVWSLVSAMAADAEDDFFDELKKNIINLDQQIKELQNG